MGILILVGVISGSNNDWSRGNCLFFLFDSKSIAWLEFGTSLFRIEMIAFKINCGPGITIGLSLIDGHGINLNVM